MVNPKGEPDPQASAKAAAGFGAWWQKISNGQHGEKVQAIAKTVKEKAAKVKWSMPVDVKVDFLQPTIQTVQAAALSFWVQLPPQVQTAAPYAGIAFGSGLFVYLIQNRKVKYYRRKRDDLVEQVKALQKEKDELKYKVSVLKAGGGIPKTQNEIKMAVAIAEATNAAAAAADAAARAATQCIIRSSSGTPFEK